MPDQAVLANEQQWQEVLLRATEEVMETMFFSTVTSEEEASADREMRSAQLRFKGDPSGIFNVSVSLGSAKQIAANFMGADEPAGLSETEIGDVVGEMANMLCGSVLSGVRSGAHFDLSHPELRAGESEPPADAIRASFELEDGTLRCWLAINP